MKPFEKILQDNKQWAAEMLENDPDYFNRLIKIQSPEVLWIGCSDSRVPADKITGTDPGEIFVHRNVANLVVHTDLNLLSVLQYAVEVLKVKHVIVCGHHNCGGVRAALKNHSLGLIDKWLWNIKNVYNQYRKEINEMPDEDARVDLLTELNVKEQVLNLAKTSIVQKAWKDRKSPDLHGWVYDLRDGIINPVFEMPAGSQIDEIFEYDNL
ncbi:MAG: carbonate dehydratase [Chitinophagaceae bacterium]|nr:carbonate dehydratase [Chitinophagaceae bacterium]